jgi:hypothetical protein
MGRRCIGVHAGLLVAAALMTGSCDAAGCSGFALSLTSDSGGQPSPVAAAEWFAENGGVGGVPSSGWREDSSDDTGVVVRSGDATVHVIQGPDGTWQVDSGQSC